MRKILFIFLILTLLFTPAYANRWTSKPPLGSTIDWGHPLAKGLVGCWLMNEGGGKVVKDISGYKNDGTLINSAKYIPTNKGLGISAITTTNDGIQIPDKISQQVTSITLTLLCYLDSSTSANTDRIFEKEYNNAASNPYVSWGFEVVSSSSMRFFAARTNNVNNNVLLYTDSSAFDRFVTLTGVYNAQKGFEIYKNGKLVASDYTKTGNISYYTTGSGARVEAFSYNAASNSISGKIIYAFLHNRSLSPQEIQTLYQDPYCFIKKPNLLNWFKTTGAATRRIWFVN